MDPEAVERVEAQAREGRMMGVVKAFKEKEENSDAEESKDPNDDLPAVSYQAHKTADTEMLPGE